MHDPDFSSKITESVQNFLEKYPEANLEDIYKGFFQDEHGPGHLLRGVDAPRRFFLGELSEMQSKERHSMEPCGTGHNFFRVSLDVIIDGFVTANTFFQAFIESASAFKLPEIDTWKKKWKQIEVNIQPLKHLISDYDKSLDLLNKRLSQGKVVMHHSKKFTDLYDPHYRIIHKTIIEKYFKGKLPDIQTYKQA